MKRQEQATEKKLEIKKDHRGWLMEILRNEDVGIGSFGQILLTVAKPGQVKGGHYHKRKVEWYCVIQGSGLLTIIDNNSHEKKDYILGKRNMSLVKIPPNNSHVIKNIGKEDMFLLVYISEAFHQSDSDTYKMKPKTTVTT